MRAFYVLLVVLSATASSHAQGTFRVTFDGFPLQAPGTARIVQSYTEAYMVFTAPAGYGFVRRGAATDPRDPDNGTAYLQAGSMSSLAFNFIDGSPFNLVSVDLAEYSTVVSNVRTVEFVGYRADGSTVTTSFKADGIIDGPRGFGGFPDVLFQHH